MKNLSDFITQLERCGELYRITANVSPAWEMAEIADRCSKSAQHNRALLFVSSGTQFPVLMNMLGNERRMRMALGVERLDDSAARIERFIMQALKPRRSALDKLKALPALREAARWLPVHASKGACQQVWMPEPDLTQLPITTSWEFDGGPFLTLPAVHTQDLHTGARNVGMYRMQVIDKNTTAMHWHLHKTGARHFGQYREANRLMPVAVTLGGDPICTYCATAPLPDNIDEYILAGFLRRRPVRLVRCLTQPLYVPAESDFVIEGYIDPNEEQFMEGPFGDHTGFYSLPDLYPRFHITAITHRKDAVYPATLVGVPPMEDAYISKATERIFLPLIRTALLPEIEDISMPIEGVSHNIAIVSIRRQYAGQAQKVANALWGAGQMMFNKILIVTDTGIDIHNPSEIARIATERFCPETDTYFGRGVLDVLDHSAGECGYGGKMCIDLTAKGNGSTTACGGDTTLYAFVHKNCRQTTNARVVVTFDDSVDIDDTGLCVWLLGNNADPQRDCIVRGNQLLIDATAKPEKTMRPFPNAAASSPAIISAMDSKWNSLGICPLIPSPSLRILPLNPNQDAERISA